MAFRGSGASVFWRGLQFGTEAVLKQERSVLPTFVPAAQPLARIAAETTQQPVQPSTDARPGTAPARSRGIRTGSLLWDSIQAVVPSMGDSITEGTIAPGTIAKAPGDAVAEDEVIAQIETDKVTIDVRAPKAGVITEILIKDDDTVSVGQVIAQIDAGASAQPAAAKPAEKEPAKAEKEPRGSGKAKSPKAEQTQPAAPKPAEPLQPEAETKQGYKPSIRFPPRYTPDGRRISSLSAEEAERVLAQLEGGSDTAESTASQEQQPQQAAPQLSGVSAALRRPPVPRPGLDSSRPGRRLLDEREMEMIELGGAPP